MAFEHKLFLDLTISPVELRDLIRKGSDLNVHNDGRDRPGLLNDRTWISVSLTDDLGKKFFKMGWNVINPSVEVYFRCRDYREADAWKLDVFAAVGTILRAFPDADAFLLTLSDRPGLLRRDGVMTLSQELSAPGEVFDAGKRPYANMLGLPYVVGPL